MIRILILSLLTLLPGALAVADDTEAAAIADLAQRLQLSSGDITVSSREEVIWPDSSAGCPQPGMAYMQVLVDGSRLVLTAAGQHYYYHARANSPYFYCATPAHSPQTGGTPPADQ